MAEKSVKQVIEELAGAKIGYKFGCMAGETMLSVDNAKPFWKVRPFFDGSRGICVSFA